VRCKPFDDALFGMKVGDIVGPVASDFGYHVIRLDNIVPAKVKPFEEVRAQIENDLKRQKAGAKFAAAADQFQNLVYEQADSLQGVAKALNIAVQSSPLVTRAQAQQLAKGSAKFVDALFSPDSVQGKRNTEAMEIAPNTLMAGRIVEHKAATPLPLDQVKDQIRRELVETQAAQAAQKDGEAKLAALAQGKSEKELGLSFSAPAKVSRMQAQPGMLPDAVQKIFRADPTKLPQYVGASEAGGDYAIYKLTQVITPPTQDPAKLKQVGSRLTDQLGREMYNAYVASVKAKTEVKINQANLEKR
jgi:peptidyl-prolyl cis-trans isomerase D